MVPESKPKTRGSKCLHDLTSLSSTSLPHSRWPSSLNYSCLTDLALADAFPGNTVHLGVFRIVSFKKKFRSQSKCTAFIARTSLTTQLNYSKLLVYIPLLYTQCLEWCLAHNMCSVWADGIDHISQFFNWLVPASWIWVMLFPGKVHDLTSSLPTQNLHTFPFGLRSRLTSFEKPSIL